MSLMTESEFRALLRAMGVIPSQEDEEDRKKKKRGSNSLFDFSVVPEYVDSPSSFDLSISPEYLEPPASPAAAPARPRPNNPPGGTFSITGGEISMPGGMSNHLDEETQWLQKQSNRKLAEARAASEMGRLLQRKRELRYDAPTSMNKQLAEIDRRIQELTQQELQEELLRNREMRDDAAQATAQEAARFDQDARNRALDIEQGRLELDTRGFRAGVTQNEIDSRRQERALAAQEHQNLLRMLQELNRRYEYTEDEEARRQLEAAINRIIQQLTGSQVPQTPADPSFDGFERIP